MKKYLFLILLFNLSFCQKQNLYVEYNLKLSKEEGIFKTSDYLREKYNQAVDNKEKVVFSLEIDSRGSKFCFRPELSTSSDEINSFLLPFGHYTGVVYNFKNDTIIKQNEILRKNSFVKNAPTENWILGTETKYIDKYLCYKATNIYKVVNPKKTFSHKVTAWYCPQLPYNYGPIGYGNLPGLILELQVRNSNYGATIISSEKNTEFDKSFLKKATIITEEEMNKKLEDFNNFDTIKTKK